MEACAWVRLSRDQLEQLTRMHSNTKRDYPRSRAGKTVLVLPFSLRKESMTLSFYGKRALLSSVYTGADPKPLKSTQIFAWTSEDPESDLQPFDLAGMWGWRQSQVPCIPHGSLPSCSPSRVRSPCTTSTQAGATIPVVKVAREKQGCQREKGGKG